MMHTPPPDEGHGQDGSPHVKFPTKPRPSEDRGFLPPTKAPQDEPDAIPTDAEAIDITTISPLAALKLLTATAEALVQKNIEAPPTPPSSSPNTPRIHGIATQPGDQPTSPDGSTGSPGDTHDNSYHNSPTSHHHHDVPHPHKTPIGSPETHASEPSQHPAPDASIDIDQTATTEEQEEIRAQTRQLARRFYSKAPPPISLEDYLKRLHTYCPMSTAVYLAAARYLQRLSGALQTPQATPEHSPERRSEREGGQSKHRFTILLPVMPKTAHRLLLAVLRVATKTLEDRTYPHVRFAKVGGVSEKELARLEIGAAFLLEFELLVNAKEMTDVARRMVLDWWERDKEAELADSD